MTQSALDAEVLYSELATDSDLAEIVEMFVDEMPDRISKLEESGAAKDWDELARTSHQIKGAAGSYGFGQITEFAARVEKAAKEGEPDDQILVHLKSLVTICGKVRAGTPS